LESITDVSKRIVLQKELARLSRIIDATKDVMRLDDIIAETKKQLKYTDDLEMIDLFKQELIDLEKQKIVKDRALEDVTIPRDEHDERSVFLEIRAGTGGQEAALFAADLLKMYTNYALKKGWKVSIVDQSFTDLSGIRDVIVHIQGDNVYGHLKFEAGVHRVQRVPKTETAGRVHTSTATVAVLPEAEEVDATINPADLRIDVFRASGAGGQHVNTTDSAVRITHIPSGVVVSCQDERSQHKNKAKALKMLQSRLLAFEKERHAAEIGKQRKEMIGQGMRSEKIRTYNFPQNRVTDHQVNLTLKNLDYIILGSLDEIIEALRYADREVRRKAALQ
jgi:peptide chain release factor 1